MSKREEIIAKAKSLRKMPMTVQQVMKLMAGGDPDVGELSRIIEFDPSITVNVLSVANSSYFGGVREITSLRDAVVRLGANRIFQLVISVGVVPYTKGEVLGYGLGAGELLKHSVALALSAEHLGRELGIVPPPHTFTSGLLVNLGKIVMGSYLEVEVEPILDTAHSELIPFEEAERRILGIDHAELGAVLLAHWGLPEAIVNVVRYRLDPEACPIVDTALDLVHAGDMITKMMGIGLGVDGLHYRPSVVVAARIGLTREAQDEVMVDVMEQLPEIMEIFSGI